MVIPEVPEAGAVPIQRPPYMSARDKRRYARTLALPEAHAERRFLQAFFEWWATCVGTGLSGTDLVWDSEALGHQIKLSELLYILLSLCLPVLDSLNMKRPAKPLEEAVSEAGNHLPTLRTALGEAALQSRGESGVIVDRTRGFLNHLAEMLDELAGMTA